MPPKTAANYPTHDASLVLTLHPDEFTTHVCLLR